MMLSHSIGRGGVVCLREQGHLNSDWHCKSKPLFSLPRLDDAYEDGWSSRRVRRRGRGQGVPIIWPMIEFTALALALRDGPPNL